VPWYEYSVRKNGTTHPLAEVVLWHGAQRIRLLALVDSGADWSLLDASYADALGLARADAKEVKAGGASGAEVKCLTWPKSPLELQFESHRFKFEGAFADFSPDMDGGNLLGRADFFKMFVVQFWNEAEMFSVDLSPDFPKPPPSP
jgi:hypothetical protein